MKNHVKLYSSTAVLYPVWFYLLMPNNWVILILTQLIMVSLVLLAALKYLGFDDLPSVWKKSVLWNTLYSFIGYLLVCGLLFASQFLPQLAKEGSSMNVWLSENIAECLNINPFMNAFSILYVVIVFALVGFLVYFMNKHFAFRKAPLTMEQKHKVSIFLAVFAGPYIALFPSYLLYAV